MSLARLALAAAVAALAAPGAGQLPRFPVGVETVYLDVFVTDRLGPVGGFGAADFEVRDNGVRQQVSLIDVRTSGVTPVLVFDTSGSLAGRRLARLREAGRAFVDALAERDQAALVTFSHEVRLQVAPTRDRTALHRALEQVHAEGATALRDALYLGLKLPWDAERPLLVVFTDGADSVSWLSVEDVLRAAREASMLVHVVASEGTLDPESARARFLRQLTETTGGALWTADSARLNEAFLAILSAMRARYLLAYEPSGVERAGLHRLKVKVKRRDVQVRARSEYSVVPQPGADPRH